MPNEGVTTIQDMVQGVVSVQNSSLDDLVLLRSDGTPTYMLAVVVDDHDMGITHVIRGDDHLNNAFRQYHIYQGADWPIPIFGHIPRSMDQMAQNCLNAMVRWVWIPIVQWVSYQMLSTIICRV